ncbi:sulfite exporter TauE/SafE family protein [Shimia ponticola]|uniref:sulfite exporter TauE/SafE family protein n=1 Tax=Shimia ponticola TaxID=2582893 RepID=UPI0011BE8E78|nr:sulfite exporter TauE/SafE family protein [Shimia ponticola]
MDLGVLSEFPIAVLVGAFLVAGLAGLVKGIVGFALPLIMVSGLSSIMEPRLALAGLLVPVIFTNALQTLRQGLGPAWAAIKEFWRYLAIVSIAILVAAQGAALIPDRVFYFVLGVPVVVLSLIQLFGVQVRIPENRRRLAEWVIGLISGVLGGFAGTWGPTTVLYLLAIEVPKHKQMVVQGVIYGVGSVMLVLAHLQSGILNAQTAPFSSTLLIPALIGLWIGFRVQDRMDQARFKKITLVVLTVAGLNLLRKGMFG